MTRANSGDDAWSNYAELARRLHAVRSQESARTAGMRQGAAEMSRHADELTKTRFLQEARAVGALEHPNICGIFEAGETEDGDLFFAMPLYDGQTLKERLAEGALKPSEAIAIARQIAYGLDAAHKVGIVPHFTGPVATAAHMQTMMAFPGQVLMEYNLGDRPVPYMPEFLECRNGKVWPNDRPGLGISIDEKALTFIEAMTQAAPGPTQRRPDGSLTHW